MQVPQLNLTHCKLMQLRNSAQLKKLSTTSRSPSMFPDALVPQLHTCQPEFLPLKDSVGFFQNQIEIEDTLFYISGYSNMPYSHIHSSMFYFKIHKQSYDLATSWEKNT